MARNSTVNMTDMHIFVHDCSMSILQSFKVKAKMSKWGHEVGLSKKE